MNATDKIKIRMIFSRNFTNIHLTIGTAKTFEYHIINISFRNM